MKVEEQISTLMKQAEARRLVSDLYNQGMPIKKLQSMCQFVLQQFIGG